MKYQLGCILCGTAILCASPSSSANSTLTLLTYNVEGLPWPIASGRPVALTAISLQLRRLRAQGRQPHLVALQEAFTADAKAIGRAAGYRYVAFGPSESEGVAPVTATDRGFAGQNSYLLGEREGKRVDSGLAIFSDYPILSQRRIGYAVCAGYDCLANKGALAVTVRVPGVDQPVTLVDTHLNSSKASGASRERSLYAFRRQVDTLSTFISTVAKRGSPLLVAGDFNVGQGPARRAYFNSRMLQVPAFLAAQSVCAAAPCAIVNPRDVAVSEQRAKDWLLYRSTATAAVLPLQLAATFGRTPAGTMLSDHVGLTVSYQLTSIDLRRCGLGDGCALGGENSSLATSSASQSLFERSYLQIGRRWHIHASPG